MILAFDIGNTHICPIIFENDGSILAKFRIPTKSLLTEDTLYANLKVLCDNIDIDLKKIDDILVSSVVPHLNDIFVYFSRKYFNKEPYELNNETVTEEYVKLPKGVPRVLGADRLATILATQKKIKDRACIIIDFGTATTFELILNEKYLGGAILPGIELSINALFNNTAKLPKVSFDKPDSILATTTVTQINTGIYYGNIGSIKELICGYLRYYPNAYVITTGGQGKKMSEELKEYIHEYAPNLLEEGLFEFYLMQKKNM